jgi:hypothetical protein
MNDGYFHNGTLNQLQIFDKNLLGCQKVTIFLKGRISASTSYTQLLFAINEPIAKMGIGLYVPANVTNTFRVFANTASGTTYRTQNDFTIDMTTEKTIRVDLDLIAKTLKVFVNGVQNGADVSVASMGNYINLNDDYYIGDGEDSTRRYAKLKLKALIVANNLTDAQKLKIENYLIAI